MQRERVCTFSSYNNNVVYCIVVVVAVVIIVGVGFTAGGVYIHTIKLSSSTRDGQKPFGAFRRIGFPRLLVFIILF